MHKDRTSWPIERGEKSVTDTLHHVPSEPTDLRLRNRVVAVQEISPAAIPHLGRALGRIHDIRKENRCQNTIRL
jgi:hypothetical protein